VGVAEPAPDAGQRAETAGRERWHRIPMFLMLRARKLA
jgi:hypothetical protein